MNDRKATRRTSLATLLFLALSADVVVRPFAEQAVSGAVQGIWMAAYDSLAVFALLALAAFGAAGGGEGLPEARQSKPALLVWLLAFSFSGGMTLLKAEEFYRYISDVSLPAVVTAAVLLAGAGYAACCGFETLSRTAQVVFWLFAASLFLLLVSNTGGMRITNLEWQAAPWKDSVPSAVQGFSLSAEWLLFLMMEPGGTVRRLKSAGGILVKVFFVFCGLCILSELVLGSAGAAQLQAAHTLARLGGLSVFRRFDALHTGIWMLAMLVKLALMIFGTKQALGRLAPKKFQAGRGIPAVFAVLAGACAASAVPAAARGSVGTAITAAGFAALLLAGIRRRAR